jgi:hypothetical protein
MLIASNFRQALQSVINCPTNPNLMGEGHERKGDDLRQKCVTAYIGGP